MEQDPTDTILNAIRRTVRSLRLFSRSVERDFGVSAAQLFILSQLDARQGAPGQCDFSLEEPLSINDLARKSFTHQSTVSEVVSRLKKKNLVFQEASIEDRRKTRVGLSEEGKKVLKRAPKTPQARMLEAVHRLPEAEQVRLATLLDQVTHAAGFGEEPATLFFEDHGSVLRTRKRRKTAATSASKARVRGRPRKSST
jgi:DNA-binding MarR family transcriptional regulator